MSQTGRAGAGRNVEREESAAEKKKSDRRLLWIRIGIAVVVLGAIVGIAFAAFYPTYIGPFQKTIITVDNTSIKMNYFLKVSNLTQADPFNTLDSLSKQIIIREEAPSFGVTATPAEIDAQIKALAQGSSANITDAVAQEWLRQKLNQTGFTEAQYRQIIGTTIMAAKMQNILASRVPLQAEEVHLFSLTLNTESQANEARAKWAAGETWPTLYWEYTTDNGTNNNGDNSTSLAPPPADAMSGNQTSYNGSYGELGWFPHGVLNAQYDFQAFLIGSDNVSDPIPILSSTDPTSGQEPTIEGWMLFYVKERDPNHTLSGQSLTSVRNNALNDWLTQEIKKHSVHYYGLTGPFDSETYAWIKYQMAKDNPQPTSTSTTSSSAAGSGAQPTSAATAPNPFGGSSSP